MMHTEFCYRCNLQVNYYSQRASPGGLLITEATIISPEAMGYPSVPGIWTDTQVAAWRKVTDAVHAKDGKIFCQLWHVGRVAHPSFGEHPLLQTSGRPLPSVSASATVISHPKSGKPLRTMTYKGFEEHVVARPLRTDEIPRLIDDYVHAARMAMKAGFDGVELHAAHGYLVDQFLQDGTNQRCDAYGGSVENRCRLLCELVEATCNCLGPGRVSVRMSPTTLDPKTGRQNQLYYCAASTDPDAVYGHAVARMNDFPLAYLLLTEPRWTGKADGDPLTDAGFVTPVSNGKYRDIYRGTLIGAGGFTPKAAAAAVEAGTYDMIAFGRWFISNPDLPERIRTGSPLNIYDRSTFYTPTAMGGGDAGYTDYPDMKGAIGVKGKYKLIAQDQIGSSLVSAAKSKL
jgi:N-ethylmaleimide reductase